MNNIDNGNYSQKTYGRRKKNKDSQHNPNDNTEMIVPDILEDQLISLENETQPQISLANIKIEPLDDQYQVEEFPSNSLMCIDSTHNSMYNEPTDYEENDSSSGKRKRQAIVQSNYTTRSKNGIRLKKSFRVMETEPETSRPILQISQIQKMLHKSVTEELINKAVKTVTRASRSKIWNFYTKDINSESAICILCHTVIKRSKGSTSGMMNHIRGRHKIDLDTSESDISESAKSFIRRDSHSINASPSSSSKIVKTSLAVRKKNSLNFSDPKFKAITNAIADFMIIDFQPINVIEGEGFRNLMQVVNPSYILPNKETFSEIVIPEMFNTLVRQIQEDIKVDLESIQAIAILNEFWNCRDNGNYVSVAIQYTTNDFVKKHFTLGCKQFDPDSYGSNISKLVQALLNEFGIKTDLKKRDIRSIFMVTDSKHAYSTFSKMEWGLIPCFADALQMVLDQATKENRDFENVLKKCEKIANHFSTNIKSRKLLKMKIKENCLSTKALVKAQNGKWISLYNMLQSFIDLKHPISIMLNDISDTEKLSENDWKRIAALIKIMKPFEEATGMLMKEKYPTLSLVFPIISGIENELKVLDRETGDSSEPFKPSYAKIFLKAFKSIFKEYRNDPILVLSMVLDPRFKTVLLEPHEILRIKNNLRKETDNILGVFTKQEPMEDSKTSSSTTNNTRSIWTSFHEKCKAKSSNSDQKLAYQSIETYLTMGVLEKQADIYLWWKENSHNFQTLSKLAQRFLSIPAISSDSGQIFKTSVKNLFEKMNAIGINPDNLEQLVLLHLYRKTVI